MKSGVNGSKSSPDLNKSTTSQKKTLSAAGMSSMRTTAGSLGTGRTWKRELDNAEGPVVLEDDYTNFPWPLPAQFGNELYGFTEINIGDERYRQEIEKMNRDLKESLFEEQKVEAKWRITYQAFIDAEKARAALDEKAPDKYKAKFEQAVADNLKSVLKLQTQRDAIKEKQMEVWRRVQAIQKEIRKEQILSEMHREQTRFLMQKTGGKHLLQPFRVGSSLVDTAQYHVKSVAELELPPEIQIGPLKTSLLQLAEERKTTLAAQEAQMNEESGRAGSPKAEGDVFAAFLPAQGGGLSTEKELQMALR